MDSSERACYCRCCSRKRERKQWISNTDATLSEMELWKSNSDKEKARRKNFSAAVLRKELEEMRLALADSEHSEAAALQLMSGMSEMRWHAGASQTP